MLSTGFVLCVALSGRASWQLPDTYHTAGIRRGPPLLKFYEIWDKLSSAVMWAPGQWLQESDRRIEITPQAHRFRKHDEVVTGDSRACANLAFRS
jgi:hypothetical protein